MITHYNMNFSVYGINLDIIILNIINTFCSTTFGKLCLDCRVLCHHDITKAIRISITPPYKMVVVIGVRLHYSLCIIAGRLLDYLYCTL